MIRVIAFIIALIIALAVAFFLIDLDSGKKEVVQQPAQVKIVKEIEYREVKPDETMVYMMTTDLNVGDIITAQHYTEQAYATYLMHPDFIIANSDGSGEGIDNMIVRSPLLNGEILVSSKLQSPGDPSYITSSLTKGMRAITIDVDTTSAVAGFIQPGDYVDMLLTFEVPSTTPEGDVIMEEAEIPLPAAGGQSFRFTETMLENIKVIAIDQQATSSQGGGYIPNTLTVEVDPTNAQKVRLAETFGTISLVLRGISVSEVDENGDAIEGEEETEESARPVSLSDLTRLFPPSYFPVLFDNTTDYNISVVDIFEEASPIASTGGFTPVDINGNPILLDENGSPIDDEPQVIALDANGNPIYFTGIVDGAATFADKDGNPIPTMITKTVTEFDPETGDTITRTVQIQNPMLVEALKNTGSQQIGIAANTGGGSPAYFEKKRLEKEQKKKEEEEAAKEEEEASKEPDYLTINVFRGKAREEVRFEIEGESEE